MALKVTGRVLYAVLFLALVPIVLIAWAAATDSLIGMPVLRSLPLGVTIAGVGFALMLTGFRDLWVYGGGLPMNADPPPHYVTRGSYRLLPHPIYTGFSLFCVGVSVSAGSASGIWLVSPTIMLACAALVIGYEHHDLRNRFGHIQSSFLPPPADSKPPLIETVRCWLCVVVPWVTLCVIQMSHAGPRRLPYLDAAILAAFAAAPFLLGTSRQLRNFSTRSLAAILIAFGLFLLLPLALPANAFDLQAQEHGFWVFFPSPQAICIFLAASALAARWPALRWIFGGLAIVAAAGLVITNGGGLLAVIAGLVAVATAFQIQPVWETLRILTERLAGSWKEWRFGPVRVINHGVYAGMGGVLAVAISGLFAGPEHLAAILVAALSAVIGAALWAQYVEGSAQLLRPYGFYGGLLGGTLGALAAPFFHTSPWMVLAVFSVCGPWAQSLGRLRCLVQGCCHGSPAPHAIGIRYVHPRSRVCRMTAWAGVPLHPTPLYSILWNALLGLLLVRLWTVHAPLALIIGLYFMLSGIGRFAEEGWRGEPQTRVIAGLRLYQWAAIASFLLGMVFSVIGDRSPAPTPAFNWSEVFAAALFGLFVCFAMGVDFPESNRRFSRLA